MKKPTKEEKLLHPILEYWTRKMKNFKPHPKMFVSRKLEDIRREANEKNDN